MSYGTKLKPKSEYASIFESVKAKIVHAVGTDVRIEHVGGTSLKKVAGKGDVDIYIAYENKKDLKRLQGLLTSVLGKPGKVTPGRVRYNLVVEGIDVEVQLIDQEATNTAVALREYLSNNQEEASKYAETIAKMRTAYLDKLFKYKSQVSKKAVNFHKNKK